MSYEDPAVNDNNVVHTSYIMLDTGAFISL